MRVTAASPERNANGFVQQERTRRECAVLGCGRAASSAGKPSTNKLGRNTENLLAVDSDHVHRPRIRVNVLDGSRFESGKGAVVHSPP